MIALLLVLSRGRVLRRTATTRRCRSCGRWPPRRSIALLLGTVIAVASSGSQGPASRTDAERLVSVQSNRYAYWRVAVEVFADHPLNGVGSGALRGRVAAAARYRRGRPRRPQPLSRDRRRAGPGRPGSRWPSSWPESSLARARAGEPAPRRRAGRLRPARRPRLGLGAARAVFDGPAARGQTGGGPCRLTSSPRRPGTRASRCWTRCGRSRRWPSWSPTRRSWAASTRSTRSAPGRCGSTAASRSSSS